MRHLHIRLTAVVLSIIAATPLFAQDDSAKPKRELKVITQSQTVNYLAKFDGVGAGTTANSNLYESSGGSIGLGTTDPKARLHIFAAATSDTSVGLGPDPSGATDTAFNIGYGGFSFGRGAGFLNVRPDALATAPNPSLRFATGNTERMIITNIGRIGIGTSAPDYLVHVVEHADANTVAEVYNDNTGQAAAAVLRSKSNSSATSYAAHGSGRILQRFGITLGGWSEILTWQGNGLIIGTNISAPVVLGTNNTEQVRITPAGNVGIGTSSPTAKLHVNGDIVANGSISGASVIGARYQDVAEWVPAAEDMVPGTVVVLNPARNNEVMPSAHSYDTTVAGVVSAQPGIILGVGSASKEQIATTGRVKVRVDATRAPIHIGDLLVTSDASGLAMCSEPLDFGGIAIHRPGSIIGKALEPLDSGKGEILVLLSLQ